MTTCLQKRRTWKRAPIKRVQHFVKENTDQKIERILHKEKSALLITYKHSITLKELSFLKRATTFLSVKKLPFSTLLSFDHTKSGYRAIWSFCEGKIRGVWGETEYAIFGEFLGKMHSSSKQYKEMNLLKAPLVFTLKEQFEDMRDFLPESFQLIEELLTSIEKQWPLFLPTGLVHTDLFPSNILFQGNQISGILQNHNMQIDILLYDLAAVMKTLYFSISSDIERKEKAFFESYTKYCPLSEEEVKAIPVLTSAKLIATTLSLTKKHLSSKEYKEIHLNSAAISLVHAEKALNLYS